MSYIVSPQGQVVTVNSRIRKHKKSVSNLFFQRRQLCFEGLEARYALSAAVGDVIETCPAAELQSPEGEQAFTSSLPASSSPTTASESTALGVDFVGPLEIDAYFQSISTTDAATVAAEGEGEANVAPTLLTFSAVRNGNYWVLTGTVTDDTDLTQCRVYYDGIMSGQASSVMPDGSFWRYIPYMPGMTTVVNAVARDAQGAESNVMSVVLY